MNIEIDDLLGSISPKLVKNYEKLNLGSGQTLYAVNEEYKGIDKNTQRFHFIALCLMMGWLLISDLSYIVFTISEPLYITLTVALFCPVIFWIEVPVKKKISRAQEALSRCTPILKAFRESAEFLKSPLSHIIDEYTELSTRDNFVTRAVMILDGEAELDTVRMEKERRLSDILRSANWVDKCQEDFRAAVKGIEKFGLKFNNGKVFADARQYIENRQKRQK